MKTPDIRRSIAPTGAPRTEPYCTTRPMFSAVIAAPAGLSRYSRSGTASCGSENCSDSPSTGSTKARRRRWFGDVRNSAIVSSCSTLHISGRSAGSEMCALTHAAHAASAADATVASPSGSAMVSGSSTSPWPPFPIAERAKRPPRRRFAAVRCSCAPEWNVRPLATSRSPRLCHEFCDADARPRTRGLLGQAARLDLAGTISRDRVDLRKGRPPKPRSPASTPSSSSCTPRCAPIGQGTSRTTSCSPKFAAPSTRRTSRARCAARAPRRLPADRQERRRDAVADEVIKALRTQPRCRKSCSFRRSSARKTARAMRSRRSSRRSTRTATRRFASRNLRLRLRRAIRARGVWRRRRRRAAGPRALRCGILLRATRVAIVCYRTLGLVRSYYSLESRTSGLV